MKRFKRSVVAAAGIAILALTLTSTGAGQAIAQGMQPLLVQIINTRANPVPVIPILTAAERVELQLTSDDNAGCAPGARPVRRILHDGTVVSPFTVPEGKLLVLTDLQGTVREGSVPWTAGSVIALVATIGQGSTASRLPARVQANGDAVASKIIALQVQSESGVVGRPNETVCVGAGLLLPQFVGSAAVDRAELQGYLISE